MFSNGLQLDQWALFSKTPTPRVDKRRPAESHVKPLKSETMQEAKASNWGGGVRAEKHALWWRRDKKRVWGNYLLREVIQRLGERRRAGLPSTRRRMLAWASPSDRG